MVSQVPPPRAALYEWLSAATAALPVSTILGAVDKAASGHPSTKGGATLSSLPSQGPHKDPLAPIVASRVRGNKPSATNPSTPIPQNETNGQREETVDAPKDNEHVEKGAPIDIATLPAPRVLFLPVTSVLSPLSDESGNKVPKTSSPKLPDTSPSPVSASTRDTQQPPPPPPTYIDDDDEGYLPLAQRSMKNVAGQIGPWKHAFVSSIKDAMQSQLSKEEILQINWEMAITAPNQLPQVLRAMVMPPIAGDSVVSAPSIAPIRRLPISFDTDGMARTDVFPAMHYQIVSNGSEVALGALQKLKVYRGEVTPEAMKPTAVARQPPRPLGSGSAGVGLFAGLMRGASASTTATTPQQTTSSKPPSKESGFSFGSYFPLWSLSYEDKAERQEVQKCAKNEIADSTKHTGEKKFTFCDRWKWTISNTALQISSSDMPRPEYVKLLLQNDL